MNLQTLTSRLKEKYSIEEDSFEIKINGACIHGTGVSHSIDKSILLTGSCISYEKTQNEIAYVELAERLITYKDYVRNRSDNNIRRHSISNGVAADFNFNSASQKAKLELIERDRILRSWYGEFSPEIFEFKNNELQFLSEYYEFMHCDFGENVVGIFGFPKIPQNHALMFGFGSATTIEHSIVKASKELLQRLIFIWDTEIPQSSPILESPTAEFHLEYYLCPENHMKVKNWLIGKNPLTSKIETKSIADYSDSNFTFTELNHDMNEIPLHVVRASNTSLLNLYFGSYNPEIEIVKALDDANLLIHPIP